MHHFPVIKREGFVYTNVTNIPIICDDSVEAPFFARKSGLDGTQISLGVENSAASGEAFSGKRKRDWGSTMKRIRPLLATAFALALVCLGGGFAFADGGGTAVLP